MLDFMLCALTNLFRIFLIGRCVSVFLGTEADKKKKHIIYGCFYVINTVLFWEFHTIRDSRYTVTIAAIVSGILVFLMGVCFTEKLAKGP